MRKLEFKEAHLECESFPDYAEILSWFMQKLEFKAGVMQKSEFKAGEYSLIA